VDVGREDLLRLWPVATWFADQPNYTASEMPMLAIARVCRAAGIKVLLSGDGADELFGGYQWYEETYNMWRSQRTRWRRAASDLHLRPFHRMVTWPPGTPPLIAYSLDAESHVRGVALFEKLKGVEPLEDRAFLAHCLDDLCGHLRGLLRRNDRMAMAASIEVRVPFLENRLIDIAMHLPRVAKYRNGRGKWVLKRVASTRLPRDVVYAPKLGFHVPYDPFATAVGLLHDGAVRDLFRWSADTTRRAIQVVQADGYAAFRLLSLELWARLFLRGESYDALGETLVRLFASAVK
jgi:asparagine synthase (glutamine-hydrolysing)